MKWQEITCIPSLPLSDAEIEALFEEGTTAPPTVSSGGSYVVNEGSSVTVTATGSDPDGDPLTYAWDLDGNGSFESPGQTVTFSAATLDGPSTHTISVQVTDDCGLSDTDLTTVNVLNVAPTVDPITAPVDPVEVGTEITTSAAFSDPGIPDTHTAEWDWGDNSTSPGTVTEIGGSVSDTHTYTTPGVYTVTLTVTDDDGDAGTARFEFVVVYDPDGGFVTGGGWIDSPAGACPVFCDDATGKANFGFVSKYKKGTSQPTGQTEFQFKAGDFNFHSTSYDWLVIAGKKAMYKGSGTVNGDEGFTFQINAIDGDLQGGDGIDKFRIKIKQTDGGMIYDNQMGAGDNDDPTTALGGGSIKIHNGNGNSRLETGEESVEALEVVEEVPEIYALHSAYPNPFNPQTRLGFDVPEASVIRLVVFDALGRQVHVLVDGRMPAGTHEVVFEAAGLPSGTYLVRLETPAGSFVQTMLLLK